MKAKRGLLVILTALMLLTALPMTAAAGKLSNAVKNPVISLTPSTLTLVVGDKYQLSVNGTSKKVTWKSSKKSVAAVNSKGVVTARKAGSATISAKVSGKTLKCKVKVVKASTTQGVWVVQAGVYNWQINLARQFLKVRDYVSDAYWTYNSGTYTIIAGTFYNRNNAIARRNYLMNNGISASVEYR